MCFLVQTPLYAVRSCAQCADHAAGVNSQSPSKPSNPRPWRSPWGSIRTLAAALAGVGRVLHFARIPGVRCDFGSYFFCDCSFLLSDPHVPIFDTAHTGAPGGGPQWSESHSNGGPCNPPAALRFGSRLPTPTVLRGFAPLRPSPGGASMSGIENGDERALGFA